MTIVMVLPQSGAFCKMTIFVEYLLVSFHIHLLHRLQQQLLGKSLGKWPLQIYLWIQAALQSSFSTRSWGLINYVILGFPTRVDKNGILQRTETALKYKFIIYQWPKTILLMKMKRRDSRFQVEVLPWDSLNGSFSYLNKESFHQISSLGVSQWDLILSGNCILI